MTSDIGGNSVLLAGGARTLDRCSNGVLWAVMGTGLYYSTDNGATWTLGSNMTLVKSIFIDPSDVLWAVQYAGDHRVLYIVRGVPNAGRTAWTTAATLVTTTSADGSLCDDPDLVAFSDGQGGTWVHIVWTQGTSSVSLVHRVLRFDANGNVTSAPVGDSGPSESSLSNSNSSVCARLDFKHTGDGKTPTSQPDLFLAYSAQFQNAALKYARGAYSAGTWTWGTPRLIKADTIGQAVQWIALIFDGTQVIMAVPDPDNPATMLWYERDAADTNTIGPRTPTPMSDGNITLGGLSWDINNKDTYLAARGANSGNPKLLKYDRTAGSFGAWTTLESITCTTSPVSPRLRRGNASSRIDAIYSVSSDGTFTNTTHFAGTATNIAPSAPTWITAAGAYDVNAPLVLQWQFNDPGDVQSGWAMSRDIVTQIEVFWNASTSAWQYTEVENSGATSSLTLPAGWGNDTDGTHTYKVKTWDSGTPSLVSVYGSGLFITPSVKVNPTITSGTTTGASTYTLTWTVTQQSAYRVTTSDGYDSGWQPYSDVRTFVLSGLANGETVTVTLQTKNTEGLASNTVSKTVTVTYVPPPAPTFTGTVDDAKGTVTIVIANPAPAGQQPALDHNEVWVTRPHMGEYRAVTGIASGGSWADATANGATTYRIVAVGVNGAAADDAGGTFTHVGDGGYGSGTYGTGPYGGGSTSVYGTAAYGAATYG